MCQRRLRKTRSSKNSKLSWLHFSDTLSSGNDISFHFRFKQLIQICALVNVRAVTRIRSSHTIINYRHRQLVDALTLPQSLCVIT